MSLREIGRILSTSKAVDVDWFATDIVRNPDMQPAYTPVFHILTITVAAAAIVNLMRSGSATYTASLNNGVALAIDTEYKFCIKMTRDDAYNLQYTGIVGPTEVTCDIIESDIPI